jgi:hypothetical protein
MIQVRACELTLRPYDAKKSILSISLRVIMVNSQFSHFFLGTTLALSPAQH